MNSQSELSSSTPPPSTPPPQSAPSTPPPQSAPSTPPPIRVPRITSNDIISSSGYRRRHMSRMNALFSPTPIHTSIRVPMNNLESTVFRQSRQDELFVQPTRISALPSVVSVAPVLTPDNPEYWRVNWRAFLNNPFAFKDAIKISPVEYQEDINKILDVLDARSRGTIINNSQPRRL